MSRIDRNVVKNELIETGEADKIEKDLKEWEENQQKRRKSRKESGSGSSSSGSKRDSKKEKERLRKEEEENAKAKQEQVKRQLFEKKQSLDEEVKRLEEERRTRDEERRRRREERRRAHEEEKKKNEAELAAIDEKIKKKEANKDDPAKKVKSPRTDEEKGHRGKSPHRRSLPCNDMNEKGKRTKSPRRSSISENKSPRKKDKEKDKEKKKKSDKRASRVASPRSRNISIQFPDPTPDDLIERKRLEEYKRIRNMDDSRFFSLDEVPLVECTRLTPQDLFQCDYAAVDHRKLRAHLLREGKITMQAAEIILTEAAKAFREEPTLLRVKAPVCVFGDIHGQFQDLCVLLDKTGDPAEKQMLFLGDYVDRGSFSTEVCLLLFAAKILRPAQVILLRGNHECRLLANHFHFERECKNKYSREVFEAFMTAFDALPLAVKVTSPRGDYLLMHGGPSPHLEKVEDINEIDRFVETPKTGALCDLLWSDPLGEDTAQDVLHDPEIMEEWYAVDFEPNPDRGCGQVFGYSALKRFLDQNNLLCVIRGHEIQKTGYYEHHFHRKDTEHPLLITVFSCPNYSDMYLNKAAVLLLDETSYSFRQFNWVTHPYVLPKFMNGLSYSLPNVIENVLDFLVHIMEMVEDVDDDEEDSSPDSIERATRIRRKILGVARMSRMMGTLREEQEDLVKLKNLSGGKLPMGTLIRGKTSIAEKLATFERIRAKDRANEAIPGAAVATDGSSDAGGRSRRFTCRF
mmetsp:Transcript_34802/g.87534  ORF Transcript_34802/g.87534 Transcript_34802/m.87534 type:complete len:745 (-) Transcript_34802:167-2401(-)